MDSTANDEQRMLLEYTERFINDVHPLERVRDRPFTEPDFSADYTRRTAELGWYSLLVPEELGGGSVSDNGFVDAAMLAAKRGAGVQPGPFLGSNVVAYAIAQAGTEEQRKELLPALLAGEESAAWAVGAPHIPKTSGGEIRAYSSGKKIELSGQATLVQEAGNASWLLVTASGEDGTVQALLSAQAAGLTIVESDSLDISRRFYDVQFDRVQVPASSLLGTADSVEDLVTLQTAVASVLTAAETVGAMNYDFNLTLQYAKDRIAFGRPIGSFQAIKHVLADTSMALEMAKALTLSAAEFIGTGDSYGPQAATIAKAFVSDSGMELAQNCFQIFGGIGFTWEHDQHLFLRRIAMDAALFGDANWQRERLCQLAGI